MLGVIGHLSIEKPTPGEPQEFVCGKTKTYHKFKRYIPMLGVCTNCVETVLGSRIKHEGQDE